MKKNIKQKLIFWLFLPIFFGWVLFFLQTNKTDITILNTAKKVEKKVLGINSVKARGDLGKQIKQPFLKPGEIFDFANLSAKSFLVYDLTSNKILYEYEANKKLPIASLTKLMTGLLAYENLNLDNGFFVEKKDLLNISPNLNFQTGDIIKGFDLFASMLIGSNNDSALLLANKISAQRNENFQNLMKAKAKELKMEDSSFSNPLGFDSKDNFSTANDLKKLVDATQNFSAFTNLGRVAHYTFVSEQGKSYKTKTTNKLFKTHPEIELVKTGHTQEAAGNLITKATFKGNKIIVIVLGSMNREADTLKIFKEVKEKFLWE